MGRFHNNVIRDLANQLQFSPVSVRKKEIARAEKLVEVVEPGKEYPYEFVCYHITRYQPRGDVSPALEGEGLREDLVRLVEVASESLGQHVDEVGEKVYSIEELAEKLGISTKTIQRWRRLGLVSRRFIFPGGRMRFGFPASNVERFTKHNAGRLHAAAGFSQLTPQDRRQIIRLARRLSHFSGCSLSESARRIGRSIGRSTEAVRQAIKEYDREHPGAKLFPLAGDPLGPQSRAMIFTAFRRGVSAAALARRYHRSRSSIYRIINEMRVHQLSSRPLKYVYNPDFDSPRIEREILSSISGPGARAVGTPPVGELRSAASRQALPIYLRSLYHTPLLSAEQEKSLFRQYNYLKYRAAKQIEWLGLQYAPRTRDVDNAERLLRQATEIKNRIIQANLRLVISVAKQHMSRRDDFFELISDGNMNLMRAIDGFDYSRGHKFSTYATWVIMRNFARSRAKESKRKEVTLAGDEDLSNVPAEAQGDADATIKDFIDRVLSKLDRREREVIVRRFGLGDVHMPQTLEQVSMHLGVTKERVRQIEQQAFGKLRHMLDTSALADTAS